jgi:hypothetical protein
MTLLARAANFSPARSSPALERVAVRDTSHPSASLRSKARATKARVGWLILFGLLAAVVAARTFNVIAVPECRATPVPLGFGREIEAKIVVSGGVPCPLSLRPVSARVDAMSIAAPPRHGVVTPRGRTGLVYRPFRGFRGEDTFSFSLHGRSGQSSGTAIVRVGVTVQ